MRSDLDRLATQLAGIVTDPAIAKPFDDPANWHESCRRERLQFSSDEELLAAIITATEQCIGQHSELIEDLLEEIKNRSRRSPLTYERAWARICNHAEDCQPCCIKLRV